MLGDESQHNNTPLTTPLVHCGGSGDRLDLRQPDTPWMRTIRGQQKRSNPDVNSAHYSYRQRNGNRIGEPRPAARVLGAHASQCAREGDTQLHAGSGAENSILVAAPGAHSISPGCLPTSAGDRLGWPSLPVTEAGTAI